MPAPGVGVILRQPGLGGLGRELNGAERGDVGDAEAWAGDEAVVRKLALDASVEAGKPLLATLDQGRDLLDRLFEARQAPAGEGGGGIAEHLCQAGEGLELGAAFPHLDEGAVPPVHAEERRRGVPVFEIAADRHRLADLRAVVELQHRHDAPVVAGEIAVGEMRALAGLHHLKLDALLGQIDQHPARIGRGAPTVELHCGLLWAWPIAL